MKHLMRKCICAILLAALMLVPGYFFLTGASQAAIRKMEVKRNTDRLNGIVTLMRGYYQQTGELAEVYLQSEAKTFRLRWIAMRQEVVDGVYTGPLSYETGFVLTYQDGKPVYPEGWSEKIVPIPENFRQENYQFFAFLSEDNRVGYAIHYKLTENQYAIRLIWQEELDQYLADFLDINDTLAAMENVYGGHLMVIKDGRSVLTNKNSDFFPEKPTVESMGLDITGEIEDIRTWTKDGTAWNYVSHAIPSDGIVVVLFYPQDQTENNAVTAAMVVLAMLTIFSAAIITWHIDAQRMVRDLVLTPEQRARFQPARVRCMAAVVCLFCALAVFGVSFYYMQIDSLQSESARAATALEAVEERVLSSFQRDASLMDREISQRIRMATLAANEMTRQPSLQSKDYLTEISSATGCSYAMLFDADGRELVSDQNYVGFTLGDSESDEMYPFRRLLQGVDTWVADAAQDSITGKTLQKIGIRVPMEGAERSMALILAFDPSAFVPENLQDDLNELLQIITPSETVCFSVSHSTGSITRASEQEMIGAQASSYGISEQLLRENKTCGITINGETWYGASRIIGVDVWFYCVSRNVLLTGNMDFALKALAAAALFLAVLTGFLLLGYTRKNFEAVCQTGREIVHAQTVEVVTSDGRVKKSVDPTRRWGTFSYRWEEMLPGEKAKLIFQLALLLVVGILVLRLYRNNTLDKSLLGFIMSGNWDRRMNLFSLTATILMAGSALMLMVLLKIIVQTISLSLGTKGETILRLLFNLSQYVVLFTVIYYGFQSFGIDTSALLGAMAFISLAVSLGARDIVADILAGITIVFEGEYQVGDIVDIGGYKGKVMEIGARSTKLMGQGDNVKIINNRDVKNVLNMTRYNSWYAMQLNIASTYPLETMETLLQKELPEIGKRIKKLISGPIYKGVENIGKSSFQITILAECREDDFRWVQRQLNREIRLLLDREQIPMV